MLPSYCCAQKRMKQIQILECASSLPTCGLKQEERDPAVWEAPLDGPEKRLSIVPVTDTDTYMGQVITKAAQLLIPIGAVFMRTYVLFLRLVFPFTRRGCFHRFRDRKTGYIGGDGKARRDGVLKMCLGTAEELDNVPLNNKQAHI